MMHVKICGITRAQDMRDAITAGADAVGLVFDQGSRLVSPAAARSLLAEARSCDPGVQTIAVVGALQGEALAAVAALDFDGVQIDARIPWPGAALGAAYALPAFFDTPDLEQRVVDYTLDHDLGEFDASSRRLRGMVNLDAAAGGGTGELSNWARAAAVCTRFPAIIAGGLTADNVAAAVRRTGAVAVDVCSGVESAAGIKSAARMQDFVLAARSVA